MFERSFEKDRQSKCQNLEVSTKTSLRSVNYDDRWNGDYCGYSKRGRLELNLKLRKLIMIFNDFTTIWFGKLDER